MLRRALPVVALALCLSLATQAGEDTETTLKVGSVAPELIGKKWITEDGKAPDLKGKVHLIDFWFAACVACVEAMPKLIELNAKYAPKGLIMVGPSMDQGSVVQQMKEKHKLTYALLSDSGPSAEAYGVDIFPSMFLVGKDGKILWKGEALDDKFPEILEKALK